MQAQWSTCLHRRSLCWLAPCMHMASTICSNTSCSAECQPSAVCMSPSRHHTKRHCQLPTQGRLKRALQQQNVHNVHAMQSQGPYVCRWAQCPMLNAAEQGRGHDERSDSYFKRQVIAACLLSGGMQPLIQRQDCTWSPAGGPQPSLLVAVQLVPCRQ